MLLAESVTVTVKVNEPAAVGVPLRTPAEVSVTPAGSVPLETANVYGDCPPVAVIVVVYAMPMLAPGKLVVVIASVGRIVTVNTLVVVAAGTSESAA
jgi:hypothetical protein